MRLIIIFLILFDADEDELSISLASGEFANGLMIDGLSIVGTPVSEQNASFDLTLSDGVLNHTKGFQINVVSSNDLPTVQYNGVEITNGQKSALSLKENFSITDWQNRLADLNISDSGQDELKISIEKHPLKERDLHNTDIRSIATILSNISLTLMFLVMIILL